ncbi:MAG: M23 family metallopeptidase [Spirochaetaceae bacterium]|nr:M23 family metallopeptidase [Spirochaetaceae bacterium]
MEFLHLERQKHRTTTLKTLRTFTKILLVSVYSFFSFAALSANSSGCYPHIPELQSRNPMFKQYQQDVEQSYKLIAQGNTPFLGLYTYTGIKGDTIMTVSARCNIPQETIATLNRFSSSDAQLENVDIILPTAPGLFIPTTPETTLEIILSKKNFKEDETPCYTINNERFFFLCGERFEPTERAFYLDTALSSPLPQGVLTSSFGMRISPITGMEKFHQGVDLAAPIGTPVLAARGGIVETTGTDTVYGNYIVLKHDNSTQSLYAHLSAIDVKMGMRVEKGNTIGKVGTTGWSTGPHLHFEMRIGGRAQQPPNSLFTKK